MDPMGIAVAGYILQSSNELSWNADHGPSQTKHFSEIPTPRISNDKQNKIT
jgi:hypothetical protein